MVVWYKANSKNIFCFRGRLKWKYHLCNQHITRLFKDGKNFDYNISHHLGTYITLVACRFLTFAFNFLLKVKGNTLNKYSWSEFKEQVMCIKLKNVIKLLFSISGQANLFSFRKKAHLKISRKINSISLKSQFYLYWSEIKNHFNSF